MTPAPFITDDEFLSVLSEGEATGAIERGEREMIQGILEFSEVMLKEVLVPRPDMIALHEAATIREAVDLFREQEYARMPVYRENLDDITGILYAKDLLPFAEQSDVDRPITPLLRKAHFVPETMTVAGFVKMAQRLRTHMAIVVDEYGGTEGLITLQDALREVVGDIGDDVEEGSPGYTKLQEGVYRIDGSLSLHELEELTGVPFEDEEHTTVAGFLMDKTDKIPGVGDRIEHAGVKFTVEKMDGKRVALLRLQVLEKDAEAAAL
jgi:putative hemolysin